MVNTIEEMEVVIESIDHDSDSGSWRCLSIREGEYIPFGLFPTEVLIVWQDD